MQTQINKSKERELAFLFLFKTRFDKNENITPSKISEEWDLLKDTFPYQASLEQLPLTRNLISGALDNWDKLEEITKQFLNNKWTIDRIGEVNHIILAMSIYEIHGENKTPAPIVINEAVELAKQYGDQKSKFFINGILDNIAKNPQNL